MTSTGLHSFDTTLRRTHAWLKEVASALEDDDRRHAYRVLRAVLQSLRDLLGVEASAHLSAQLPMLVRGFFYEGWRPGREPRKIKTEQDFYAVVKEHFGAQPLDANAAVVAVFKVLADRVTEGEVEHVKQAIPKGIRGLWPHGGGSAVFLGDDPHLDALAKPVSEFMTPGVLWTPPDGPLAKVLARMNEERVRHALVVAPAAVDSPNTISADAIVGILSSRDVLRHLERSPGTAIKLEDYAVHEVMTPTPLATITPASTLGEAAEIMRSKGISALPVIEDGLLEGIVTTDDLLNAGTLAGRLAHT